jgi:hypothetical protein
MPMKLARLRFLQFFLAVFAVSSCGGNDNSESLPVRAAKSADQFVESVGVNVHLDYTDTEYNNFEEIVVPSLQYLGVRHVRTGIDDDQQTIKRQRVLSKQGIGILGIVPYKTPSMPALIELIGRQKNFLEAVEGPNETDEFAEFSYKSQMFPKGTIAFMRDFSRSMRASNETKKIPIVQTSIAFPELTVEGDASGKIRAEMLGDLSTYADIGNGHTYISWGDTPFEMATARLSHIKLNTPGKPYFATEVGYQMGESDGLKGEWNDGESAPFDEEVHGRYLTRSILEMFRNGYTRSYIYELLDIDEPQWGMFAAGGEPKAAADGIHALLRLLSDSRWDVKAQQWETKSFQPDTLGFSLGPVPDTVHSLLLQKSNGTFYLVVWNEVKNWDAKTGKPIEAESIKSRLQIELDVSSIREFVPSDEGTTPTATYSGGDITVNILDRPTVLEIKPK